MDFSPFCHSELNKFVEIKIEIIIEKRLNFSYWGVSIIDSQAENDSECGFCCFVCYGIFIGV